MIEELLKLTKKELKIAKGSISLSSIKSAAKDMDQLRNFTDHIRTADTIAIIPEIKSSQNQAEANRAAIECAKGKATAISLITEDKPIDYNYILNIKNEILLPVLYKELVIDEYQIYRSRVIGADAILLTAGILGSNQLKEYVEICKELSISTVIEIHNENELEKTIEAKPQSIAFNNSLLDIFEIDIEKAQSIIKHCTPNLMTIWQTNAETIPNKISISLLLEMKFNALIIHGIEKIKADIAKWLGTLSMSKT